MSKKSKDKIVYLDFTVNVHSWSIGGEIEGDRWSRDSTEATVSIEDVCFLRDEDGYQRLGTKQHIVAGDRVYLVYAVYTTGDSFGSDGGNVELLSVFKDRAEAEESKEHYSKVRDYSVPWNGYFESLDELEIEECVVA